MRLPPLLLLGAVLVAPARASTAHFVAATPAVLPPLAPNTRQDRLTPPPPLALCLHKVLSMSEKRSCCSAYREMTLMCGERRF